MRGLAGRWPAPPARTRSDPTVHPHINFITLPPAAIMVTVYGSTTFHPAGWYSITYCTAFKWGKFFRFLAAVLAIVQARLGEPRRRQGCLCSEFCCALPVSLLPCAWHASKALHLELHPSATAPRYDQLPPCPPRAAQITGAAFVIAPSVYLSKDSLAGDTCFCQSLDSGICTYLMATASTAIALSAVAVMLTVRRPCAQGRTGAGYNWAVRVAPVSHHAHIAALICCPASALM